MLETVEATIDPLGNVTLNEKIRLNGRRKALVTILDDTPENEPPFELVGSLEIVGDIESGSKEISDAFKRSIERSAKDLDL